MSMFFDDEDTPSSFRTELATWNCVYMQMARPLCSGKPSGSFVSFVR
jgi:hypothetical protein